MVGASVMPDYSDDPNFMSIQNVRLGRNDRRMPFSYYPNMARKAVTKTDFEPDWYLVEWMRSKHMTQAALSKATGWSKATTNDIYHGKTAYYREILNKAAAALQVSAWELLMPPEQANAIKKLRAGALEIAADRSADFISEPELLPISANRR